MIRYLKWILVVGLVAMISLSAKASGSSHEDGKIDVKSIVLGHMSDGYDWHITTYEGHHISIPLLVIVKGENSGWNVFSSSKVTHGDTYNGFYINETNGKIYEKLADGSSVRPLDISITKNVVQLWIVVALMLTIFLSAARWYKKNGATQQAPKGFFGVVEMMVMMVHDDIIRPSVGEKQYKKFAPYLLTCFFFIFISNLLGLIPIFPGGANLTGNITITFFLAFCTLLAINLFGNKEYWKEIFWPPVPVFLKCPLPIMPLVEMLGIISRPFSLMVRLFANIMGGHAAILSFTCVIFIAFTIGIGIGSALTPVSLVLMIFMNCLECLVAFIQAYVFTMLSAVFIGMAHPEPHHH
jgi:F-type H+-transporting ATPase subunit a